MNKQAWRVALLGLLTALTLILGYIESRIPVLVSVPGIKLGLSNSVILYAVFLLGWKDAALVMLTKVALSAALFGNPSVFLYSLAGGALSLAAMALCQKCGGQEGTSSLQGLGQRPKSQRRSAKSEQASGQEPPCEAAGTDNATSKPPESPKLGVVGVSVIGAVCHNLGQLLVAWAVGVAPVKVLVYYLAVLSLIAIATGALTGIIAGLVMKRVKPFRQG